MTWYPRAERVPWRETDDRGRPTFYKGRNKPAAVILHVMAGYASTARQWASAGHYGASWHFTVARDSSVMQHLDFEDGGYHAGITDVQARQFPPVWPLWKGLGQNVNTYSIGVEHEGFPGSPFTPEQQEASRELLRWLAGELGIPEPQADAMVVGALGEGDRYLLHYPPHAAIDRVNRVNDFNYPRLRAAFYDWLKQEETMTDEEFAERLARIAQAKGWFDAEGPIDKRLRSVISQREALRQLASDPDAANVQKALNGALAALGQQED